MTKEEYKKYIDEHTLRLEASYRGGGIEIDLGDLLGEEDDEWEAETFEHNQMKAESYPGL